MPVGCRGGRGTAAAGGVRGTWPQPCCVGGCWLERWGAGEESCWVTTLTFLQAHLPLLVCMAAQGFDARRQMPGKFNPAGLGAVRQGIATPTFNHLSKGQVSLKSLG